MIDEIILNLCNTFRSTDHQTNEQIFHSEERLKILEKEDNFIASIFQIIISDFFSPEIRKASLLYLRHLLNGWSIDLAETTKKEIIDNFPMLLDNSCMFLDVILDISFIFVNCTFFVGDWPNLINIIQARISTESVSSSIILLNSLAKHFKGRSECVDEINFLFTPFYPFFHNYINTAKSFTFIGLCYQILRFLNSGFLSEYFKDQINLNDIFINSSKISDFQDTTEFKYLAKQVMKFCAMMIQKYPTYIDLGSVSKLFESVMIFFNKCKDEQILGSVSQILNAFFFCDAIYINLMNNLQSIIITMILPFYLLNEQDMSDSRNDVSQFLAKFQVQDFFFKSEFRAYLYATIHDRSKRDRESPKISSVIFNVFHNVINQYFEKEEHTEIADSFLFSVLFLFSSVSSMDNFNNMNKEEFFVSLLSLLTQLLSSPSHLVVSGALLCLKNLSCSFIPPQLYFLSAKLLLSHPSLLVRYYAATAFSELLKQPTENREIITNEFTPIMSEILKAYVSLSSEFCDFEFIDLISNIVDFFGSSLICIAPELIIDIFNVFLNYQNAINSYSFSGSIVTSLFRFIQMINEQNNLPINQVIVNPLLERIIETINLIDSSTIHVIFGFLANLTSVSQTISPYFWKIYEIIPQIIELRGCELIEDGFVVLRNVFFRDRETGSKPEILNFTIQMCLNYLSRFSSTPNEELFATMLFTATVLKVCPPQSIDVCQLYQILLPLIRNLFMIQSAFEFSSPLFLSMLVQNPTYLIQILGDDFLNFCSEWADNSKTSLVMFFIMNFHQFISKDCVEMFLIKIMDALENDIENGLDFIPDDDDGDDCYEYVRSYQLYNSEQILEDFRCFMSSASSSFPSLYEKFVQINNITQ